MSTINDRSLTLSRLVDAALAIESEIQSDPGAATGINARVLQAAKAAAKPHTDDPLALTRLMVANGPGCLVRLAFVVAFEAALRVLEATELERVMTTNDQGGVR